MAKIGLVFADREEIFREGLMKLLESEPDIEVACSCRTGFEVIGCTYKYQPDITLIDTELLDCSLVEVVQCIHKDLPKTNIVVLSHSETDDDLVSAIRAGAKAYLSKDISIGSLIKAIILVAEGGVVVSPPMAARLLAEFNILEENKSAEKLASLLSHREWEVLILVAQGFTNKEIGATLTISDTTVKVHLRNVMEKLHAHTRQQAVSLVGGKDLLPRATQTDTKQA